MSLLQSMPYSYYIELKSKGVDWCERLAKAANLNNVTALRHVSDPVTELLNKLDSLGFSLDHLKKLDRKVSIPETSDVMTSSQICDIQECQNSPSIKFALLIGNKDYKYWPELVTPETDCKRLEKILQSIGFITITVLNITADQTRKCIKEVFQLVPPNAYCFIYYAGHGIEVGGTRKYILGIDCPETNCSIDNGVSEHYIIRNSLSCRPDLSVILFDMCRQSPTEDLHPQLFADSSVTEEYTCDRNLLIGYSTSPFMMTFEKKHKFSETNLNRQTVCCDSGCTFNLGKNMSIYVEYLTKYLKKKIPIRTILDHVHKEFSENDCEDLRQQRPQKLDNTYMEYYLTTPEKGDPEAEILLKHYAEELHEQLEDGRYTMASTCEVK